MPGPRTSSAPTPAAAPHPPEGWRTGPPDYVGVGAAHAGSTWWDGLILAHPGVARAPRFPTSVDYFASRWQAGLDELAMSRYHAWFPRPPRALVGEWTATYMLDPWVPALLRRTAPNARLLVLLRDPVARFGSGHASDEGREQRGVTARAAANASFSRGLYADQLMRLWSAFPRDQVLVSQYERCRDDPRAELRRTFAFLGLDPDPADEVADALLDDPPTTSLEDSLDERQAATLARAYAPENVRLAALLPDLDLGLWTAPREAPGDAPTGVAPP